MSDSDRETAALDRRAPLPERLLAKLWQAKAGRRLRTVDGRTLRVLYPGRPAPGHGPDFWDALLELEGMPLCGDVEIHRRPQDWRAHQHHLNREFDSVVLHVVGQNATSGSQPIPPLPTVIVGQSSAPQDRLSPMGPAPLSPLSNLPAYEVFRVLEEAGLARYDIRVQQASEAIHAKGAEQALYEGILESLGYSENRAAFEHLSRLLPVADVRKAFMACPPESRADALRYLLLTTAGWEPPRTESTASLGAAPIDVGAWRVAGVRPSNHPRNRLEGAAALLCRHLDAGLIGALVSQAHQGVMALMQSMTIEPPEGRGSARLIGRARAMDMAINVVLPTLEAWGSLNGDATTQARCRQLYREVPALQENTITKEARRLSGNKPLLHMRLSACMQQGLQHLYRQAVGQAAGR